MTNTRYEPHQEISNPYVHLYAPQCYTHPTMVYFSLSSEAHLANKAFKKYLLHIKKFKFSFVWERMQLDSIFLFYVLLFADHLFSVCF